MASELTLLLGEDLASLQEPTGCFASEVTEANRVWTDHNGFVTAMVLRTVRRVTGDCGVDRVRLRALDFVERCRSSRVPGAFGFWPEDARPGWASNIPPDVDDTAVMSTELLRHGRLTPREGLRTAWRVLVANRVPTNDPWPRPPWVRPGAFLTWIADRNRPNLVDCCVNANALALLASLDATQLPGFRAGVETVLAGLEWADGDRSRLRCLAPFYPSIRGLHDAVAHAIDCGVLALRAGMPPLAEALVAERETDATACCCSAYGRTVWRCRALDLARRTWPDAGEA